MNGHKLRIRMISLFLMQDSSFYASMRCVSQADHWEKTFDHKSDIRSRCYFVQVQHPRRSVRPSSLDNTEVDSVILSRCLALFEDLNCNPLALVYQVDWKRHWISALSAAWEAASWDSVSLHSNLSCSVDVSLFSSISRVAFPDQSKSVWCCYCCYCDKVTIGLYDDWRHRQMKSSASYLMLVALLMSRLSLADGEIRVTVSSNLARKPSNLPLLHPSTLLSPPSSQLCHYSTTSF